MIFNLFMLRIKIQQLNLNMTKRKINDKIQLKNKKTKNNISPDDFIKTLFSIKKSKIVPDHTFIENINNLFFGNNKKQINYNDAFNLLQKRYTIEKKEHINNSKRILYSAPLLAHCYFYGFGTEINKWKSKNLYKEAFQNYINNDKAKSIPFVQDWLGTIYRMGIGTPDNKIDNIKSNMWYSISRQKDYSPSHLNLGFCYWVGWGIKQNFKKATDLFQLSNKKGNACAQFLLAQAYKNGKGVEINKEKAIVFYEKSAYQGYIKLEKYVIDDKLV